MSNIKVKYEKSRFLVDLSCDDLSIIQYQLGKALDSARSTAVYMKTLAKLDSGSYHKGAADVSIQLRDELENFIDRLHIAVQNSFPK